MGFTWKQPRRIVCPRSQKLPWMQPGGNWFGLKHPQRQELYSSKRGQNKVLKLILGKDLVQSDISVSIGSSPLGMSTFEKLHRTRRASTRHSTPVDELPPSTRRGPLLSPTHRQVPGRCPACSPSCPDTRTFPLPPSPCPRTSFLASCTRFSSSSGIILPLREQICDTVTLGSEQTWDSFVNGIDPPRHRPGQASGSCPRYLPSVSTKHTFSVPIPRKEADFFME